MMEHPNIAKVLDAGATDAGRPYFVMELVRGIRITDYCDQNKLPTSERLKLFTQVCQAIQHAHQKGVIHRDIKPSNILVTLHDGAPVPKVIDFGIAKATQGKLTDQTLFTAFEQFIGTPAYMSPEQVEMSGLDIDTRSDIYSLGVLLYELLVGTTPFEASDLVSAGLDHMRRMIREQEPPRPSTRLTTMMAGELTTTAERRRIDAPKLIHLVRGDLDWIVMKCLEKDRTRRYETANGLARDIERHLGNEPVVARPPSSAYRFQKFVRRNKVTVIAVAMVAAALVLGALTSTWAAIQATRAKREQTRLRGQAQAEARVARLRAYASEVSVALQAWESGNPSRARALLERQRPKPGEEDLRGFEWRYLYGRFQPQEIATLSLHSGKGEVWGSAWSADGKHVALGTFNSKVEVWDWISRTCLEVLPACWKAYSVVFSPDGSKLAYPFETGPETNWLRGVSVWDLRTRQLADQFLDDNVDGDPLPVFSHSGHLLAYVLTHGYQKDLKSRIVICDLTRKAKPFELTNHVASLYASDFSPDDRHLVTPQSDGTVILWDLKDRKIIQQLTGHHDIVFCARFSPDGQSLATGGIDSTVRLWDLRGDVSQRSSFILGTHNSSVFNVDFSPDGRLLVSASLDHTAKVWDVAKRQEVETLCGHDQRVWSASFSSDGRYIMTGSEEGNAKIWRTPEIDAGQPLDQHATENYNPFVFSSDGHWLLAGEEHDTKLFEIASRRTNILSLVRCTFSPDAKSLAGLTTNGEPTLWTLSIPQPRLLARFDNTVSLRLDVDLAFSPDGRTLAGATTNGEIKIWNVVEESPRLVRTLSASVSSDSALRFSPDGQVIAVLSETGSLSIWNWIEGRQLNQLRESASSTKIVFCVFSPNGRMLLTRYKDGGLSLWDWDTAAWKERELPSAEEPYVFSPDSRWIATCSSTRTEVKLWDVANLDSQNFASGSGPVDCLDFAPDGRTMAVGTRDGWINLWHLPSRQQIISLKAHRSHAWRAVFSPDGRALGTTGSDGKLRLWFAPTLAEADANSNERR
jgi:WD40 repeat protein